MLVACPHGKLNGVKAPALTTNKTKPERLWGVNTIERRAASHAYCQKRMFIISNMFVVSVILVAIANGKKQGAG